jgi:hypothetical protein
MWIPEAVAVIAAIEAPLMKVRRAIIFSSRTRATTGGRDRYVEVEPPRQPRVPP